VASAVFRDRYGCWGWLDLWRFSWSGAFDISEVTFLTDIVERVTLAIRLCQANTFVVPESGSPRSPGPAVLVLSPLVLSPNLDVTMVTPQSQEYLS
jgi:hypothetical protein